jgi:alpha-L-rhamnosidase
MPPVTAGNPAIGFIHRKLADGEIYFIANTGNRPVHTQAQVRVKNRRAEWWDPFQRPHKPGWREPRRLDLAPYESRVLVFSNGSTGSDAHRSPKTAETLDVSSDWKVAFPGRSQSVHMATLRSWSDYSVSEKALRSLLPVVQVRECVHCSKVRCTKPVSCPSTAT